MEDWLDMEEENPKRSRRRRRLRICALALLSAAMVCALLLAGNALLGNPLALPVSTPSPAPVSPTPYLVAPGTERDNSVPALEVYFIDVGQGDCMLLLSPNGKTMLVDAGEKGNFEKIDQLLRLLDIGKLDVVVSTHAHSDHAGSMADVIRAYPIGAFYLNAEGSDASFYQDMMEALSEKHITPTVLYATMISTIDWDKDVMVRVLSPYATAKYEDLNESSIVLNVSYGATSVLLAADTGALAERLMLKALPNVYFHASVLKLGHHGSYSSTTKKFLKAVKPLLAVATCGKDNAYGHPHEEIRDLLTERGVPLLTTAESGTIHLLLDGLGVMVVE